jgi:hypothetical protein
MAHRISCGAGRAVLRWTLLSTTILGGLCLGVPAADAVDGTWLPAPATADWNTGTNWSSSPAVPDGTASFGASTKTSLTFSAVTTNINTLQFNAGAPAYTFTIGSATAVNQALNINGTGIGNNSSFAPTFNILFISSSNQGTLNFNTSSTAGNAIVNNTVGGGGFVNFNNNSSAGTATITNTAFLGFGGSSTAGNSTIINSGITTFAGSSTAGNAIITNNQGLIFGGSSTAGNATIITNAGSNNVGTTFIFQTSSGGNARFITNAGGTVDFSTLTTAGTTAGSIEGAGTYALGSKNLTVGSNNLSTTVSGVIADGGVVGGTGASLTKVGSGTLVLSGADTYSGPTTIAAGTLTVNGSIASSTVTVNAGATLSGTGTVGGLTIASGGMFAPGNSPGTMTVAGNLAFQSGALYVVQINSSTAHQCDRQRHARRHRAGGVRRGQLCDAHLHDPLRGGWPRRHHVQHAEHEQSARRLHRLAELQRDRRDPQPHRHTWTA